MFRGGGEMASGAVRLLFLSGFRVVVLEREAPLAVRRRVAFAEAVFSGAVSVESVPGRLASRDDIEAALVAGDHVPVAVDPAATCLSRLAPAVLVDARMAKKNLGTTREQAPLVVGLGPGFVASRDVDAVVETQRGPQLGRVLWSGSAEPDTSLPAPVLGKTASRVVRAPAAGAFRAHGRIGELVRSGELLGEVAGQPVLATIDGLLRGLLADGVTVGAGAKLGDIDPRGAEIDPGLISDKARAVAAGVMEAVLMGGSRRAGTR